jgi:multidrug resistance efflux pump
MARLANLFVFFLMLSPWIYGADHVIGIGNGQWIVKSRMTVEFSKSTPVINLMRWPMIVDLIPDGSLVKEGDLLVRFDRDSVEKEIESKRYDLKINELYLNKSLKDIENKVKNLEDSLQEKKDQLSLLQARKNQWLSIPLKKDVDKAQGEVDVAELNHRIAVREVEKAERRFEKAFVSKTELLNEREDFRRMEAEWLYAQQMLSLSKQPTTTSQMKKLNLEMKSVELDIKQLEKELEEQAFISDIQKKSEKRRMRMAEDELKDKEKELKGIELRAPCSGLVRFTVGFKRSRSEGKKPRKSSVIMEIPDLTSLILKGVVPEREGYHLRIGDHVDFYAPHLPKALQKGKVTFLSSSPRDITEGSDDWSMMGKESGIKVFDVVVTPLTAVPGLKLGMTADATLFGSDSLEGPCVPLSHVWLDRSDFYLAIKTGSRAVYEKVEGYTWENFLFLNGETWLGQTVALNGEKPVGEVEQQEPSGQLTILGELSPSDVLDVFIPDFNDHYSGMKLSWLPEEGSFVEKGDVIARCVSEKADSRLRDAIAGLERVKGDLKTTMKEMALREQARVIDLKKAKYDLDISKINHEVNQKSIDAEQYYSSHKDMKVQEVNLESARRTRDDRIAKKGLYSPKQVKDAELNLQVADLNHRSAEIKLSQVSRGAKTLDLKKSEIDLLRKENDFRQLEISQMRERSNDERSLISRKKKWSRSEKKLEDIRSDLANFEIKASQSGILKFVKVWDGVRMSKINANSNVRRGTRIMSLTGTEDMFVKLEVPERYSHLVGLGMSLELAIPGMGLSSIPGKVVSRNPIFERKKRADTERIDLYSRQEDLGYSVFTVSIALGKSEVAYKIGSMVQVRFPFEAYP